MITIKTQTYDNFKKEAITSSLMRILDFVNSNPGIKTLLRGSTTAPVLQTAENIGKLYDLDIPHKIARMSENLKKDFYQSIQGVYSISDLSGVREPIKRMLEKYVNAGGAGSLASYSSPEFIEIADIMLEEIPYARSVMQDVRKNREGTGTAFGTPTAKGSKIDNQIYSKIHSWLIDALDELNGRIGGIP